MGRCLTHVSKRPSARDLLLDPFLATEHLELSLPNTPLSTNQTLRVNSSTTVANELLPVGDQTSTDMAITGSINEEDNTIFLKVRISDEMGKYNFIPTLRFKALSLKRKQNVPIFINKYKYYQGFLYRSCIVIIYTIAILIALQPQKDKKT